MLAFSNRCSEWRLLRLSDHEPLDRWAVISDTSCYMQWTEKQTKSDRQRLRMYPLHFLLHSLAKKTNFDRPRLKILQTAVHWYCEAFQCFDTVGWATGRSSACKKLGLVCWWWQFDWSFAHLIAPVVTTTAIIVSSSITG